MAPTQYATIAEFCKAARNGQEIALLNMPKVSRWHEACKNKVRRMVHHPFGLSPEYCTKMVDEIDDRMKYYVSGRRLVQAMWVANDDVRTKQSIEALRQALNDRMRDLKLPMIQSLPVLFRSEYMVKSDIMFVLIYVSSIGFTDEIHQFINRLTKEDLSTKLLSAKRKRHDPSAAAPAAPAAAPAAPAARAMAIVDSLHPPAKVSTSIAWFHKNQLVAYGTSSDGLDVLLLHCPIGVFSEDGEFEAMDMEDLDTGRVSRHQLRVADPNGERDITDEVAADDIGDGEFSLTLACVRICDNGEDVELVRI